MLDVGKNSEEMDAITQHLWMVIWVHPLKGGRVGSPDVKYAYSAILPLRFPHGNHCPAQYESVW